VPQLGRDSAPDRPLIFPGLLLNYRAGMISKSADRLSAKIMAKRGGRAGVRVLKIGTHRALPIFSV
jgi:hypothetical protein